MANLCVTNLILSTNLDGQFTISTNWLIRNVFTESECIRCKVFFPAGVIQLSNEKSKFVIDLISTPRHKLS